MWTNFSSLKIYSSEIQSYRNYAKCKKRTSHYFNWRPFCMSDISLSLNNLRCSTARRNSIRSRKGAQWIVFDSRKFARYSSRYETVKDCKLGVRNNPSLRAKLNFTLTCLTLVPSYSAVWRIAIFLFLFLFMYHTCTNMLEITQVANI